jgi:hypothetical protein
LLDVAEFTTINPLSLPISRKLAFPIVGLKMSSLPTLALKSHNKGEFIKHTFQFLVEAVRHIISFYLLLEHEHSKQ